MSGVDYSSAGTKKPMIKIDNPDSSERKLLRADALENLISNAVNKFKLPQEQYKVSNTHDVSAFEYKLLFTCTVYIPLASSEKYKNLKQVGQKLTAKHECFSHL